MTPALRSRPSLRSEQALRFVLARHAPVGRELIDEAGRSAATLPAGRRVPSRSAATAC